VFNQIFLSTFAQIPLLTAVNIAVIIYFSGKRNFSMLLIAVDKQMMQ